MTQLTTLKRFLRFCFMTVTLYVHVFAMYVQVLRLIILQTITFTLINEKLEFTV